MKPLILSFFLVILSYSLFVEDDKTEKKEITPKTQSIHINSMDTTMRSDTLILYAKQYYSLDAPYNHTLKSIISQEQSTQE